jgi:hypothetical protein
MTNPYSGSSAGTTPGYGQPAEPNYAVPPESYGAHRGDTPPPPPPTPVTDTGRPDVEGTSVGELIGEVTRDLSTLMRQELDLAKVEMKAEAKKAGQGAGMFGAAGFAGYMTLLFLSIALWWALENVMDAGLAALIVAVIWAVIAAITYAMGRKRFREFNPKPERTLDTLQQVPDALKPH